MALTKKKGPVTTPKLPNIEALKKVNNNNAGAFYNDLLNAKHKIEYESRDISLFNIRTNPDNEIFREIDDDEDIRILADDIKRNGLLHNLVMFPSTEEGERSMFFFPVKEDIELSSCLLKKGIRPGRLFGTAMSLRQSFPITKRRYCFTAQTCRCVVA